MNNNAGLGAIRTRIIQIVFGLVLFGAGGVAVNGLMYGSFSKAAIILAVLMGTAIVLALDRRYWLAFPVLSIVQISIPGLPFKGTELACLVVAGVHGVRLVLKQETQQRMDLNVVATLPMLLWILFIWMLNPVGLAMFGTRIIGGRFYFDIVLGFLAFLSLASLQFNESDAKLLFYTMLGCLAFKLGRGVVFPGVDPDALVFSNTGLELEVSSRYAFVTCASIFMLLFSKWSIRDVFASPIRIVAVAMLAILTVYSGKRQALGMIVLVPVFRMLLKRKDVLITCFAAVFVAILLAFCIAGDGVLFSLPRSAKRTLAVVAPRYERETAGGIHDIFRREVRQQGYWLISDRPWFGRKGFAMNLEDTRWMNFGGGFTSLYAGHAYAGNWHNMWLAYACDFGLPCLLLAVLFWLYLIRFVFLSCNEVSSGVFLPACCLYFSYELLSALVFSWVAGHASNSTYMTWIQYGFLIAVVQGYRVSQRIGSSVSVVANPNVDELNGHALERLSGGPSE